MIKSISYGTFGKNLCLNINNTVEIIVICMYGYLYIKTQLIFWESDQTEGMNWIELLMWYINIFFNMLSHPHIPKTNLTLWLCIIILMCCRIQSSILLRIFTPIFIKDITVVVVVFFLRLSSPGFGNREMLA